MGPRAEIQTDPRLIIEVTSGSPCALAQRQPRLGILLYGCLKAACTINDKAGARNDLLGVRALPVPSLDLVSNASTLTTNG
jgi:hypothetical protein